MVTVGGKAPALELEGVHQGKRARFGLKDKGAAGQWTVLVFYPADFSFVCPTEVVGFSRAVPELAKLSARVLGVSSDGVDVHEKWAAELGGVAFPLLSDPGGKTIAAWGVTDPAEPPRALRATFVVDPAGEIGWASVSRRNVGRSIEETLRVLAALQTNRLCPVDWQPGQPTIEGEGGKR